ncbi:MAG: hypothetical protein AAF806_06180, partial [Bacteroidota bacterium]
DKIFVTLPYMDNKQRKASYFEVLVKGQKPLLCHYQATTQNVNDNPLLGNTTGKVKIVIKEQLYYGQKGKVAMKLSKSKKEFLATFGKQASKIEKYMKENKLSSRKKEEVVEVFEYYNELIL